MSNSLLNCCDECREKKPLTLCTHAQHKNWTVDVCNSCIEKHNHKPVDRVWEIRATKDGKSLTIRYNRIKQLLYRQNRSHDRTMSFEEFIDVLKNTKKQAKERGFVIKESFVKATDKW